ncbi:MAG: Hydroxyisourate hydrolase [Flaviaesturariibacter sp.]|nr:Hydroxyisourate hydrolase [Flaviaesturariibacter sp.]
MQLEELISQTREQVEMALHACCGSDKWADRMLNCVPFTSVQDLINKATTNWYEACDEKDWLEAFTHHPKIGDRKSLEEKFAATKHLAGAEQAGVADATTAVIERLEAANKAYEDKFGFIFIVCATGKSAAEMLRLLEDRLQNTYPEEITIAMGEQHKITIIRLKKLLADTDWSWMKISQLTTHVLDTSLGKPGKDITIKLKGQQAGDWRTIAQGVTNSDGRIADLLPPQRFVEPGIYKMVFQTAAYFQEQQVTGFYPEVEIQFTVFDQSHYHVPLLINPFGFSTYRGS